jgi:hypothetical protein
MSILDDAIREHLELKRAHGADDAELKKLEDEAFGPPARPDEPDPLAEAPTEFMGAELAEEGPPEEDSGARRLPNIADLQEAPEPPQEELVAEEPAADEPEAQPEDSGPTASHSTEERHAIAEQPTEMFDVEGEIDAAPDANTSPSDDELLDAELTEPRLAPVDPLEGGEPEDEFDEYFSEQRLSDELSQALDAPLPGEPQIDAEQEIAEEEPQIAEEEIAEEDEQGEIAGEEIAGEEEDELEAEDDEYEDDDQAGEEYEDEDDEDDAPAASHGPDKSEDVLEDTPDFLEDTPEDDDLWFEQRPPKDFDFDD